MLGDDENSVRKFRFLSQIFERGYFAPYYEQNPPPKWQLRASCGGPSCHRLLSQISADTWSYPLPCVLDGLLQPVLLDSASSSCCCTFQSFALTFASPWQSTFVQISDTPTIDHLVKRNFVTGPSSYRLVTWDIAYSSWISTNTEKTKRI